MNSVKNAHPVYKMLAVFFMLYFVARLIGNNR